MAKKTKPVRKTELTELLELVARDRQAVQAQVRDLDAETRAQVLEAFKQALAAPARPRRGQ